MSSMQDASPDGVVAPAVVAVDEVAWLVALRCIQRVGAARQVRLTGLLKRPAGGWSRGDRQRLVRAATAPVRAVVHGDRVEEPLGSHRWLAWFPRPIGPYHAINVPSAVVDRVARRVPGIELVRAHLAMRSWRAELVQAIGTATSTDRGRGLLQRWVAAGGPDAVPASRWACVVEVVDAEQLLVRGWAHGTDRAALGAALAEEDTPSVSDGSAAAEVLDTLASHAATGLRWSVGTPAPLGVTGG